MENPSRDRFASRNVELSAKGQKEREEPRLALSLVNHPARPDDGGAFETGQDEAAMYAAMLPRGRILAGISRRYLLMAGGVGLLLVGFIIGRNLPASNAPAPSAVSGPGEAPKVAPPAEPVKPVSASSVATTVSPPSRAAVVVEEVAPAPPLVAAGPAAPAVPAVAAGPAVPAVPVVKPAAAVAAKAVSSSSGAAEAPSTEGCRLAIKSRDLKGINATCERALGGDPSLAKPLLAIAKGQFEKGKSAQAAVWARKIVQVNSSLAEAYLIIGVAEQEAHRPAAAKAAYQRYLELAPQGAYAQDVRSSLKSF
jgi:hypothetical protein